MRPGAGPPGASSNVARTGRWSLVVSSPGQYETSDARISEDACQRCAGDEDKVEHTVKAALRAEEARWPHPDKDAVRCQPVIARIMVGLTIGNAPVKVVIADGNDRQDLLSCPGVEELGLAVPLVGA